MAANISYTPVDSRVQRADYVPSNLAASGLLSETNKALLCYTKQVFSGDLQVFLINYNISVNSFYPIFKG